MLDHKEHATSFSHPTLICQVNREMIARQSRPNQQEKTSDGLMTALPDPLGPLFCGKASPFSDARDSA